MAQQTTLAISATPGPARSFAAKSETVPDAADVYVELLGTPAYVELTGTDELRGELLGNDEARADLRGSP